MPHAKASQVSKASYSITERRIALLRGGVVQKDVASEMGVYQSLVADVVAGRRVNSLLGRPVAERLAELIGVPLETAFPEVGQ